MKLLTLLYAAILRLYPPAFRDEFASEMQAVFVQALQETVRRGKLATARFFLHEIGDLPANLAGQFWAQFRRWSALSWQEQAGEDWYTSRPGSTLSAGLAGLPHLLFALSLYLPLSITTFLALPHDHGSARPAFWMVVAAALLVARKYGWPRWSSSWMGYGLVFLLEGSHALFPTGLPAYFGALAWLTLAAILLLWRTRRDWISGLLAVLPVSPMWFWLERGRDIPVSLDAAALYVSISLMVCLAVIAIVRLGRWQTALLLILAVILATGTPDSYHSLQPNNPWLPGQVDPAAWGGFGGWMASYTVLLAFTAPLWLMATWRQLQRRRTGSLR